MGFSWGFREGKTPLLEQLQSVSMMLSGRTSRVIEDCQYFGIIYLSKNTCLLCFPPEVCWLSFSTESALRVLMLLASLSVKIISLCFVVVVVVVVVVYIQIWIDVSFSASSFLREIGRLLCSFPELTTPVEMGNMVINQTVSYLLVLHRTLWWFRLMLRARSSLRFRGEVWGNGATGKPMTFLKSEMVVVVSVLSTLHCDRVTTGRSNSRANTHFKTLLIYIISFSFLWVKCRRRKQQLQQASN